MNEYHQQVLASPEWAEALREDIFVPWLDRIGDLGDDVLELGPGPGLTTAILLERLGHITAVELDPDAAAKLAAQSSAHVVCADAASTGLPANRFSAVVTCSMFHHIPTVAQQHSVLEEAHRVLRAGGQLIGVDGVDSQDLRAFHVDDVFNPMAPEDLRRQLTRIGFTNVRVECDDRLRFVGVKKSETRQPYGLDAPSGPGRY